MIAVTDGIMRILDEDELEGVLAHELSHVEEPRHPDLHDRGHPGRRHHLPRAHGAVGGDLRRRRRSDDEEGGSSPIAMIAMAILAPIAAMLVQMAVSRSREFQADATGAQLAGRTWGLAKALEKLEMASARWRR